MSSFQFILFVVCLACFPHILFASDRTKPHGHQGVLEVYDGKPLPLQITSDQDQKLNNGEPVVYNERTGKSGRGVVIQDINASTDICMGKIRDLLNYNKMVPHVKSVTVYDDVKFANGTSKVGAEFQVGLLGVKFGYFLRLTHEPKYNTLTWTLDYNKNSDFDDNVGHWQVMPHPSKTGWTRILYSCKIKLFNWIPEFVVNFLTGKALTESTSWVKRESELEARRVSSLAVDTAAQPGAKKASWFNFKGGAIQNNIADRLPDVEGNRFRRTSLISTKLKFFKR